ncbi:DCC1-like thiol-disulfide oxidoreductase family protein [Corticibacterium sp. UT-5YL-CI-8]|nr:DCC1-like thiol-disulfide oxidoreductase family protein [Tianweitania sp. UT-5YL-CI-8]
MEADAPTPDETTNAALADILAGRRDVVVFDGVCVMCSALVRFTARVDTQQRFEFVTAQSPLGDTLYRHLGLGTDVYETNIVFVSGTPNLKSDSLLALLGAIGWPWRAAMVFKLVPKPIRDGIYGLIARNRYRLFGRTETCEVPPERVRKRLIA